MPPRTIQAAVIVASAGVTLLGVAGFGWSLRTVVLLYWVENLIIGGYQLVKLLSVREPGAGAGTRLNNLPLALLFTVHYGGFCFGHGLFILMLTSDSSSGGASQPVLPAVALLSVSGMIISRGIETWTSFFASGRWKQGKGNRNEMLVEPYKHIIIVHIAIMVGASLIMAVGSPVPLLLVVVAGKLLLDLRSLRIPKAGPRSTTAAKPQHVGKSRRNWR